MNKQTYKLLMELQESVDKQTILIDSMFPKCPKCKHTLYTEDDRLCLEVEGMCVGCSQIQGEIDSMMVLEAQDQISSMAEANGVSVEEYMDEMGL